MLGNGATHVGVATDHVIESFRNDLWPGYKTGAGIDPALRSQFDILETALRALGVGLWPMVELEADDALASAAHVAAEDPEVRQVIICTPDKDLAQCVVGDRVVQLDRRTGNVSGEDQVWEKFGVAPRSIPDWLALVGDSADGFPGLAGWGKRSAARWYWPTTGRSTAFRTRWPSGIPRYAKQCAVPPSWPNGSPTSASWPSSSVSSPPSGLTPPSSTMSHRWPGGARRATSRRSAATSGTWRWPIGWRRSAAR